MSKQNTKIGGIDILVQGRWTEPKNLSDAEFEYRILDKQSNIVTHHDGSSLTSVSDVTDVVKILQSKGSRVSNPTFSEKVGLASIIANLANLTFPAGHYA